MTPRFPTWLLRKFGSGRAAESLLGDLIEEYQQGKSTRWFWAQAISGVAVTFFSEVRAHAGGAAMPQVERVSAVLRFMGRNLLAFVASAVVLAAGVYAPRLVGRSVPFELVTFLSCLIATAIALRLRARAVAFLVVGLGAWRLSMFFVRTVYGGQWAQTEAQFAAMIAGVVGAIFGAALVWWAGPPRHWLVGAASNSTSPVRRRGLRSNTERPSQPHTLQGVAG